MSDRDVRVLDAGPDPCIPNADTDALRALRTAEAMSERNQSWSLHREVEELAWYQALERMTERSSGSYGDQKKRTGAARALARRLFSRCAGAARAEANAVEWTRIHWLRWVDPHEDGDRPADLADAEIAGARRGNDTGHAGLYTEPNCRRHDGNRAAAPEIETLLVARWHRNYREWEQTDRLKRPFPRDPARAIRETHPAIHRALSGDATIGPTIKGCPWCKAGGK